MTSNNRIRISRAKDVIELSKLAVLEECGDELIYMSRFGKSAVLDVDITETVWSVGGERTLLFTEQTTQIVSTSGNDTALGTGARAVHITGLDNDYNIITEVVVLNGVTPVTLANKYLRIERSVVVSAGTSKGNQGTITLTETGGSTVQGRIEVLRSQSQIGAITIPAGYTGLLPMFIASCYRSSGSGTKRGELDVVLVGSDQVKVKLQTYGLSNEGTGTFFGNFNSPFVVTEKREMHFDFTAESAGTFCSVAFNLLLVKGLWSDNNELF